jgi:hypothetical protein
MRCFALVLFLSVLLFEFKNLLCKKILTAVIVILKVQLHAISPFGALNLYQWVKYFGNFFYVCFSENTSNIPIASKKINFYSLLTCFIAFSLQH